MGYGEMGGAVTEGKKLYMVTVEMAFYGLAKDEYEARELLLKVLPHIEPQQVCKAQLARHGLVYRLDGLVFHENQETEPITLQEAVKISLESQGKSSGMDGHVVILQPELSE